MFAGGLGDVEGALSRVEDPRPAYGGFLGLAGSVAVVLGAGARYRLSRPG